MPAWQGIWLADLLNGLDMGVTIKQYKLAHFDVVTSMMTGFRGKSTDWLLHDSKVFEPETLANAQRGPSSTANRLSFSINSLI